MIELKRGIESNKVFFGVKQVLKNTEYLEKVVVAADCRDEIVSMLEEKNFDVELVDFSKEEISSKLELDFKCEVFGMKK